MNKEKIFVLVPVYKAEAYLERCIDSIINQTYTNWELVLVDDGSPDGSGAICDRYAAEYENITVIHQENSGVAVARNTGVSYALEKGDHKKDWINFVDSDDFVHPKYLEYLYCAAKESGREISSCRYAMSTDMPTDTNLVIPMQYSCVTPEEYWAKSLTNATVIWGKLYRVHLFENIRYPAGKLFEDNFITYKLLFQFETIAVISTPLYHWYINPGSITRCLWTPARMDALTALDEQIAFFTERGAAAAYTASVRELLWHSVKQLMFVKHLSPRYDSYIPKLKAYRRRAFRLYTKEVGLKKALDYWYLVRIKRPMKRILGKESLFSFLKRRIKRLLHLR